MGGENCSSVSKLASNDSQFLPGSVVRKCQNQFIKVLKVGTKHCINLLLYKRKMDINSTKFLPREAGASKVPAAARFFSSPVCLPSRAAQLRGGVSGGEACLCALHSGKLSHSRIFKFFLFQKQPNTAITHYFSYLVELWYAWRFIIWPKALFMV